MVSTIRDGNHFARGFFHGFHKVLAGSQHLNTKLHAAANDGLRWQLRRKVDGHKTGRSNGKKHLDSLNGGIVDDGHFIAFLQAYIVEQSSFARHNITHLLIGIGVDGVGEARQIRPLLLNPCYKFGKGGNVHQLREFLGRKHTGKIRIVFHNIKH